MLIKSSCWVCHSAREHYEKPAHVGKSILLEFDDMRYALLKNPPNSGSGKQWIAIQDNSLSGNVGVVIAPLQKTL